MAWHHATSVGTTNEVLHIRYHCKKNSHRTSLPCLLVNLLLSESLPQSGLKLCKLEAHVSSDPAAIMPPMLAIGLFWRLDPTPNMYCIVLYC
jgi:hypothetical protein